MVNLEVWRPIGRALERRRLPTRFAAAAGAEKDLGNHIRVAVERERGDHAHRRLSRRASESCSARFCGVAEGVAHDLFEDDLSGSKRRPRRYLLDDVGVTLRPMVGRTANSCHAPKKRMMRSLEYVPFNAVRILCRVVETVARWGAPVAGVGFAFDGARAWFVPRPRAKMFDAPSSRELVDRGPNVRPLQSGNDDVPEVDAKMRPFQACEVPIRSQVADRRDGGRNDPSHAFLVFRGEPEALRSGASTVQRAFGSTQRGHAQRGC